MIIVINSVINDFIGKVAICIEHHQFQLGIQILIFLSKKFKLFRVYIVVNSL